jgi:acetate kinase
MKILIANPGSSSVKCQLLEMPSERQIARVRIERVGSDAAPTEWTDREGVARQANVPIRDLNAAIRYLVEKLTDPETGVIGSISEVSAVGFKTVYANGTTGCQYLDDRVLTAMADLNEVVAPLHNPVYIQAVESFREILPDTPMVGLFENHPFDQLPDYATVYPIPWDWTVKYGIRKHMFHGSSHRYVSERIPQLLGRDPDELRLITCHLGGSSTLMAFKGGVCIDGTGGFTLQCGVPFSVRASDMDAFLIAFLVKQGEGTVDEVVHRMMTEAGLSGISGMGFDFRDLEEAAANGHERAQLAIDTYVHAVRKYIGAFMVELGGLDVITLAGGTGEAGASIRKLILEGMEEFGIVLDDARNEACFRQEGEISAEDSRVRVWVVPTDEEIVVAREVYKLINGEDAAPDWLAGAPLFRTVRTEAPGAAGVPMT